MGYRGEDLDLRTPQGWGSGGSDPNAGEAQTNGWWTRSTIYAGGRADPLWVDSAVLECCNHAFDLALAHRAGEVRLEHLLHAMTLNEAAALVLDQRGFRVSAVRRDSGQLISGEAPAGPPNARPAPRKSRELEETLRLAADHAYPRRTPITTEDILHVLTELKTDSPGAQILLASGPGGPGRETPEPRREAPARGSRPAAPEAQHLGAPDGWGERPSYVPYYAQEPLGLPPPHAPALTLDALAEARLATLERIVRDLLANLGAQRRTGAPASAVSPNDVKFNALLERLNAIERHLEGLDGHAAASGLLARLNSMEASLERVGEAARASAQAAERLRQIERALAQLAAQAQEVPQLLQGPVQSLAAWGSRLEQLERTGTIALDRLTGLERQIQTHLDAASAGPEDRDQASAQLVGIERVLQSAAAERDRGVAALEAQLGQLARTVEEHDAQLDSQIAGRLNELLAALERRMAERFEAVEKSVNGGGERSVLEMHDSLLRLSTNQAAIASALDQLRLDSTGDLAVLGNRLQSMESLLTKGRRRSTGRLQRWLSGGPQQEPGKTTANAERVAWHKRRPVQAARDGQRTGGEPSRPPPPPKSSPAPG